MYMYMYMYVCMYICIYIYIYIADLSLAGICLGPPVRGPLIISLHVLIRLVSLISISIMLYLHTQITYTATARMGRMYNEACLIEHMFWESGMES